MTKLLLAALLVVPASAEVPELPEGRIMVAQAVPDVCAATRVLDRWSPRLRIEPVDGSAPVDVVLAFRNCLADTMADVFEPMTPTAVRYFGAPGSPWVLMTQTEKSSNKTLIAIGYNGPGKEVEDVVAIPAHSTMEIVTRSLDWGVRDIYHWTSGRKVKARVKTL